MLFDTDTMTEILANAREGHGLMSTEEQDSILRRRNMRETALCVVESMFAVMQTASDFASGEAEADEVKSAAVAYELAVEELQKLSPSMADAQPVMGLFMGALQPFLYEDQAAAPGQGESPYDNIPGPDPQE